MPFIVLAIPVLHSSGAWIAYAGTGYLAGTISSTWIGTFILGNASLLSGVGLISAAGVAGASGLLATIGTGAALTLGKGLTAVGLGGVASWLGVAPVATFLGLTPVGWAIAGTATAGAGLLTILTRGVMRRLNEERAKGGLEPISARGIVREVREFEMVSKLTILRQIAREDRSASLSNDEATFTVNGKSFSVARLRYRVCEDQSEEIVYVPLLGRRYRVYVVHVADPEI